MAEGLVAASSFTGWTASPAERLLCRYFKGTSIATDAAALSADESAFPAGTGLECVRKTAYYFLHDYRRKTTTKH